MISEKLSTCTTGRNNNYNLIRFIAASLVILSHSFPLALGREHRDPLHEITGTLTLGTVAVDIFFVTSGFLITSSLLSRKDIVSFIRARVLRIYPALVISILICAFVVGPMFTTRDLSEYFLSREMASFITRNSTLAWSPGYLLPGVFEDNPYSAIVNGSLWTLPWEVRMYALLAATWLIFKRHLLKAVTGLVVLGAIILLVTTHFPFSGPRYVHDAARFVSFFFIGSLCYINRDKIILDARIAIISIMAMLAALLFFQSIFYPLYLLSLPYLVLCAAYLPRGFVLRYNNIGDYSYGLYIYAFPVQQGIVALSEDITVSDLAIAAWLITLVFAAFSWHFIEKPMLKKKNTPLKHLFLPFRKGLSLRNARQVGTPTESDLR